MWRVDSFFLKGRAQKVQRNFCLHLIGQNLVIWTHLAARESGECTPKLDGQVPANWNLRVLLFLKNGRNDTRRGQPTVLIQ